jgi:hypothetical protein
MKGEGVHLNVTRTRLGIENGKRTVPEPGGQKNIGFVDYL